jgi:hypothetical protein
MTANGVYLYGFIPVGSTFDPAGIEGVGGGELELEPVAGRVSAVVEAVDLGGFEAASGDDVDAAWLLPRALRHEAVLPARFGALFSGRGALRGTASLHEVAIAGFLEGLGDRREWSLRGYLELEAAAVEQLETHPALAARHAALPSAPGARYFLEKRLRDDARTAAKTAAITSVAAVRRNLRAITPQARTLPLRAGDANGRAMLLHEAVLLPRGSELEALAAVKAVAGPLVLEPSGPWPPFHFCPDLSAV